MKIMSATKPKRPNLSSANPHNQKGADNKINSPAINMKAGAK